MDDGFRYLMVAIETGMGKPEAAQFLIDAIRYHAKLGNPPRVVNRIAVLDLP